MKILLFTPGMWIYFPAGLANTKVRFIKLERAVLDHLTLKIIKIYNNFFSRL